jgi:hypothetical protein
VETVSNSMEKSVRKTSKSRQTSPPKRDSHAWFQSRELVLESVFNAQGAHVTIVLVRCLSIDHNWLLQFPLHTSNNKQQTAIKIHLPHFWFRYGIENEVEQVQRRITFALSFRSTNTLWLLWEAHKKTAGFPAFCRFFFSSHQQFFNGTHFFLRPEFVVHTRGENICHIK